MRIDGNQTGNRTGGDAEHGRLTVRQPFREHPGERGGGGGDLRDGHRHAGRAVGGDRRTGVEAEPADPQEAGADHGQDEVVGSHVVLVEADARPQDDGGDEDEAEPQTKTLAKVTARLLEHPDIATAEVGLSPPLARITTRAALSNSFAFGGNNCSVLLGRPE